MKTYLLRNSKTVEPQTPRAATVPDPALAALTETILPGQRKRGCIMGSTTQPASSGLINGYGSAKAGGDANGRSKSRRRRSPARPNPSRPACRQTRPA